MLYVYKNRVLNRLIGLGISNSAQLPFTPESMNLEPIFGHQNHIVVRNIFLWSEMALTVAKTPKESRPRRSSSGTRVVAVLIHALIVVGIIAVK